MCATYAQEQEGTIAPSRGASVPTQEHTSSIPADGVTPSEAQLTMENPDITATEVSAAEIGASEPQSSPNTKAADIVKSSDETTEDEDEDDIPYYKPRAPKKPVISGGGGKG